MAVVSNEQNKKKNKIKTHTNKNDVFGHLNN
jgi:hypothetical protein